MRVNYGCTRLQSKNNVNCKYSRPVTGVEWWRHMILDSTWDLRPHETRVLSSCLAPLHSCEHRHWADWEHGQWSVSIIGSHLWVSVLQVQDVHWGSLEQLLWQSLADWVLEWVKTTLSTKIILHSHLMFLPTNILFLMVPLMKGLPVSMFWKSIIPPGV